MVEGKFSEAIPIYKHLVQSLPGNPGLLLNLALAQHMDGRERDAIPNLETVLKSQPAIVPALLALGQARLSIAQPKLAIPPLRKALTADPDNADAHALLGSAFNQCKRFDEGAEQYRRYSEISPRDTRAWYALGKTYEAIATSAFENLDSGNPKSPYLAALVADTRVQRRQYGSAFIFYKQVIEDLPTLRGVHAALAEIYRKTGHPQWAAEEDTRERTLPATDCKLHPAECQFAGGHDLQAATLPGQKSRTPETFYWQAKAANELAFQAFSQLGQLPPSVQSHQLQAEIARNQNQHLKAVSEWRAALELAPNNPQLRQELAISLFLAQDYRPAIDQAEALLKTDPKSSELNFIVGDSLLRLGEPENSLLFLRTALSADPQLTAANASLGLALSRTGKSADAIPFLLKSLNMDDNGDLHYQLARAYQSVGDQQKARTAMQQYQSVLTKAKEQKNEVAQDAQIGPPK